MVVCKDKMIDTKHRQTPSAGLARLPGSRKQKPSLTTAVDDHHHAANLPQSIGYGSFSFKVEVTSSGAGETALRDAKRASFQTRMQNADIDILNEVDFMHAFSNLMSRGERQKNIRPKSVSRPPH